MFDSSWVRLSVLAFFFLPSRQVKDPLDEALAKEAAGLQGLAGVSHGDLRLKQLSARADAKEKKEALKAERKKKQEAKDKEEATAAPKKRGRPRTTIANEDKKIQEGAKKKGKTPKQDAEVLPEPEGEINKGSKKKKPVKDKEPAVDEKAEEPKENASKKRKGGEEKVSADPPTAPDKVDRKKHRRDMQAAQQVQEVDEELGKEILAIMKRDSEKQHDRPAVRDLVGLGMYQADVKLVFYWDRNAVGVQIRKVEGGMTQRFYFSARCMAVAGLLAKRMRTQLERKDREYWVSEAASIYEQVLRNSAMHAYQLLDSGK